VQVADRSRGNGASRWSAGKNLASSIRKREIWWNGSATVKALDAMRLPEIVGFEHRRGVLRTKSEKELLGLGGRQLAATEAAARQSGRFSFSSFSDFGVFRDFLFRCLWFRFFWIGPLFRPRWRGGRNA